MKIIGIIILLLAGLQLQAAENNDFLVKVTPAGQSKIVRALRQKAATVEELRLANWLRVKTNSRAQSSLLQHLARSSEVLYVQPNYKLHIPESYRVKNPETLAKALADTVSANRVSPDNPPIPPAITLGNLEPDPLSLNQWGMIDIGASQLWAKIIGNPPITVAVIDTGVDYTHEDLLPNIWRNAGETGLDGNGQDKSSNGVDDDNNGYVDDVVGWDFVSKDNRPYDLASPIMEVLKGQGNPGHGTHCAGNVAARGFNGIGVAGANPSANIMALRFISEKDGGLTSDAVLAIHYAVDNGAKVLSNSWGSEGDDPEDTAGNQALRDAIIYSRDHNTLFVAAAGNGHTGVGYDNDTDAKPGVPASYDTENIISVAALDTNNKLGSFSNWGKNTVDIGAPGVKVYSTTVDSKYTDTIYDKFGITATWDGTSMAAPHVAGAVSAYWAQNPSKTYAEVKEALLKSATPLPALSGKVVSGGKLNEINLMTNF